MLQLYSFLLCLTFFLDSLIESGALQSLELQQDFNLEDLFVIQADVTFRTIRRLNTKIPYCLHKG